jgi:phosphoglucosamine mutase
MLEQALSAGICSVGVDVQYLGPLPTPGIAYLTRGMRACAGIVISASHNPFEDNGIKIFSDNGFKLPDEIEMKLENMVDDPNLGHDLPTGMSIGSAKRIDDAVGQYAVFVKEQFPKHLTLDGLRIVIDCANGAAYKVAPKVFSELGAEIFVLGNQPDGKNINYRCGALHPQTLTEKVKLYKADIGIALDGDADRLIVVDNNGEIVDGDQILAICAQHMHSEGKLKKSTVVSTVMSNMGLEISLQKMGINLVRSKVGDRYVVDEMRKGGYNLGGEQSGHLVFADCSTTGDGILAALHLLEVMLLKQKTLAELKGCMELFPQVLKNIHVSHKKPFETLPEVHKLISDAEQKLGQRGRVLVRYSGTENLARVMLEGQDHAQIEVMANDIIHALERAQKQ